MDRPLRFVACSYLRAEFEAFIAEELPEGRALLEVHEPYCAGLRFGAPAEGGEGTGGERRIPSCPLQGGEAPRSSAREAGSAGCVELLAPPWLLERLIAEGAFLFGPGWLRDWEANLALWELGHEDLLAFAQEAIPRLCLLDTLVYPDSEARLAELSAYLGIPATRIPVGLEPFRELQRARLRETLGAGRDHGAAPETDYALALDILARLAFRDSEAEVIRGLLDILDMLFAPAELLLLVYRGGRPATLWRLGGGEEGPGERLLHLADSLAAEELPVELEGRLLVPLDAGGERMGLARLGLFALPERREDYRRLLESLGPICALALANARSVDELRRRGAEALEAKQTELLASLAFRDRLLSIIGHDLRAPMGVMVELLEDAANRLGPELPGEDEQLLAEVFAAASRSYELLQNLLDWSRMQGPGRLPVLESIEAASALRRVFGLLESLARHKGISLSQDLEPGLLVQAEASSLETILRNLVSNAVKFSPKGSSVRVEGRRRGGRCLLRVIDEGVGMSPERLEGARRSYLGRSAEGTEGERGSGLGLLLVRDLAEKLGGSVELESELGKGTIVSLDLTAPEG